MLAPSASTPAHHDRPMTRGNEPAVPRKRQTYPPARTATKGPPRPGAGPEVPQNRPNLVAIDLTAGKGREVSVGDRARIGGSGRYAGEVVVIERVSAGVIPS